MKIVKNKFMATLISLILIVSIAVPLMNSLPIAKALTHTESATYAFVTASPDPVGVGQTVTVMYWLIEINPLSGANQDNVWHNFTLTITNSDGKTQTIVNNANSAAGQVYTFAPDKAGNYTFTFNFPGEQITSSTIDNYFKSSTATTSIVVQQEPTASLPQNPLPSDYWQRPINWENQAWYSIAGNWFGDINLWESWQAHGNTMGFNPDTVAPQSAHVLWTLPIADGGQIGGSMYSDIDKSNYFVGKSYKEYWTPPVIINGIMYYNSPLGIPPRTGVTAVDLLTGKEIWHNENIPSINFGTIYSEHNPNEVGGWPYLWSTGANYTMYDANTGRKILDVTGMAGTPVIDPTGQLLVYRMQAINASHGFLSMWNASRGTGSTGTAPWNTWSYDTPAGGALSYTKGIQWNVTVPIFPQTGTSVAIWAVNDGVVLVTGSKTIQDYQTEAGYDAIDGHLLWNTNRSIGMIQETTALVPGPIANGIYTEHNKEAGTYWAFDIHTGVQLWVTEADPNAWNIVARQGIGDGNVFMMAGVASGRAYNATNGKLEWEFFAPPAGLESVTPTYPFEGMYNCLVGGGLTFLAVSDSHGDQLFRGAKMYAVNMTTGIAEWSIDGFYGEAHAGGHALADGYLVAHNMYDNQVYIIGKGRSATTIAALTTVQTLGTSVLIQGTVTDQSPGQTCLGIPAAGTPAISDASMSEWTSYLYMQKAKPANATGVPVSIDALDPNGNLVHLGDATSDANGQYYLKVKTDAFSAGAGTYTVMANFAGTNSYYRSSAETFLSFDEAAPTVSPIQLAAQPNTEMYIVGAAVAIIITIVIVAAILLMAIRRRP
jgi:PQQ-like domain